ncbi:MAG: hypothetical protein OXH63_13575 [Gemmatimonadetes bacterium]|nr:hypothetical protein [Gemmatimonadota bacterium]
MSHEPTTSPEWRAYACKGSIGNDSYAEIDLVHHTAHVPQAQRIIEDGRINAALVYDESRLNRSRLAVSWLSANRWGLGSIYGNVDFSFRWPEVVAGRRIYWVEAITDYRPPAYRFLLTKRDLSDSKLVQRYCPADDDGPLRFIDGKWYANLSFTSEFMIDDDLPMEVCRRIDFVQHHPSLCKDYGSRCKYRCSPEEARFLVLATVLAHRERSVDALLWSDDTWPNHVDQFVRYFEETFSVHSDFDGVVGKKSHSDSLILGVLSLCGSLRTDDASALFSLFRGKNRFRRALYRVVADHYGLDSYDPRRPFRQHP